MTPFTREAIPPNIQSAAEAGSTTWAVPDYLEQIIAEDPAVFRELLQLFLEDAAENIGKLTEQVEWKNEVAIGKILHSLKGSSVQIGAIRFSELVGYLSTETEAGRFSAVSEGLLELRSAFELVKSEIEAKMATLPTGESSSF